MGTAICFEFIILDILAETLALN